MGQKDNDQPVLAYSSNIERCVFRLANIILKNMPLDEVVDEAAAVLGAPIILVDSYNRILAASEYNSASDMEWSSCIERRYCDLYRIASSAQKPYLFVLIINDGKKQGMIVCNYEHSAPAEDKPLLARYIGWLLMEAYHSYTAITNMQQSIQAEILYSLLSTNGVDDIKKYINSARLSKPEMMQVAVTCLPQSDRSSPEKMVSLLREICPCDWFVNFKDYTAALIPALDVAQLDSFSKTVAHHGMSVGLSWAFSDIIDFRCCFYQAVSAIKEAARFDEAPGLYPYTEYLLSDLFYNYTGKIPLSDFRHPALHLLWEYDRENNTELYPTLMVYVQRSGKATAAADELIIHRNTLIYRLKRIREITSLDLDDTQLLSALKYFFALDHFLNTYE